MMLVINLPRTRQLLLVVRGGLRGVRRSGFASCACPGGGGHVIGPPVGGPARVADVLADLVSRGPRGTWLDTLVADCRTAVSADGAGLVVADATGPVGVVAATPGVGQLGEDLQFTLGEGPCRTASGGGRLVRAPDLVSDARWPMFSREAVAHDLAAAFCVPLAVGAVRVGVLNAYRRSPGELTPGEHTTLGVYGEAAVALLLLLQSADPDSGDAAGVADLADLRPVVHQAAGMVSVQLDTDLLTAMLRLRGYAFAAGRTLREVAADVVDRRLRLTDLDVDDDREEQVDRP